MFSSTMSIYIESKRRSEATLKKLYPDAVIIDVTSHANDEYVKFSPFYPHGGIPIPFSANVTSMCVEGIWQGLKVFNGFDVDRDSFRNSSMKDIKRTTRRFGKCLGHRKGVYGKELLEYIEARKLIYLPSYKWVLEHKIKGLVEKIKQLSVEHTVVLLDYETNSNVLDHSKPLSHASLIKAYIEGSYPEFEGSPVESIDSCTEPVIEYKKGQTVNHDKFGKGIITGVLADSERIVVNFDSVGEKTLASRIAHLSIME